MMILRWLYKFWDRVIFFVSLALILTAIAFGYGFYMAEHHVGPYYKICAISKAAFETYSLQVSQLIFTTKWKRYPFLWFPTYEPSPGVVVLKPDKVCDGLTFFSDCTTSAYLMDLSGKVLHKWHKPFYEVWPRPKHIKSFLPASQDEKIYWCKARLFPNGDILAIYQGSFIPYGGGLVKLDAQSRVIWAAAINAHHDLDVDENGNIYVITHKYNYSAPNARMDDYITILSPDGETLQDISLYEAFINSPFMALIPPDSHGDYLHTNNVDVLTEDDARGFPFLQPGDILLSHLNINAITILDGHSHKLKWALSGVAWRIHDADFLDNGHIVFFNNTWPTPDHHKGSRIVEWDCINNQFGWVFTSFDFLEETNRPFLASDMFFSLTCGAQQRLPNGNYLITESNGGTLLEVTPGKEVVWKYVTSNWDGESVGNIYQAERYSIGQLPFLQPLQSGIAESKPISATPEKGSSH